MRKIILFSTAVLFAFQVNAQWALAGQGTSATTGAGCEGFGISIDPHHNFLLGGYFNNTFKFGSTSLTTVNYAPYVAKFNAAGTPVWAVQAKSMSGSNTGNGFGVATDMNGNVYANGTFVGSIQYGTTTLTYPIYDANSQGIFLVKYDSNGHLKWAKQATGGSNYYNESYGIETDSKGDVYIAGYYTDSLQFGNVKLNTHNTGALDYSMLVKFDTAGHAIWGRSGTTAGTGSGTVGNQIAISGQYVYMAGYYQSHAAFGTDTLNSWSYTAFLSKYDTAGNVIWATGATVSPGSNYCYGYGVAVDGAGNIYMSGKFNGTVKFGTHSITNPYPAPFLVKYDQNGNVIWVQYGTYSNSNYQWSGNAVAADNFGHEYLICSEWPASNPNSIKFGTNTYSYTGATDPILFLEFDSTGNVMCGNMIASGGDDGAYVTCDATGQYVYVGGDLETQVTFGSDIVGPTSGGGTEFPFVAKWTNCDVTTGINSVTSAGSVTLFPNPNNGIFQLKISNYELGMKSTVEIYNVLGEKVYSELSTKSSQLSINISNQPSGIYLYLLIGEEGDIISNGKFVIQK